MRYDADGIYRNTPPHQIPWIYEDPPDVLVNLVKSGTVRPCKTVDLGCGTGNYAMYLADQGFDVTGIDNSPTAIAIAMKTAKKRGIPCRFITGDLLGDLSWMQETFRFGLDWKLLHTIYPEDRPLYLKNLCRLLEPGALYLSVSFSDTDPGFGGSGKFRRTPINTTLYFSSEEELQYLFSPDFTIRELKTIDIPGKPAPHKAIYLLAERR
jgi:SAM-dependent methyltransferase